MGRLVRESQCIDFAQDGGVQPPDFRRQFGGTRAADAPMVQLRRNGLNHVRLGCVHTAPFSSGIAGQL
jgi:hypothetical protein